MRLGNDAFIRLNNFLFEHHGLAKANVIDSRRVVLESFIANIVCIRIYLVTIFPLKKTVLQLTAQLVVYLSGHYNSNIYYVSI